MNEISTIIRARLDEGRAIADEDVRQLLAERDALQARVAELEAALATARRDALAEIKQDTDELIEQGRQDGMEQAPQRGK